MTDEDIEKIIKRNMNLQMNFAGIRADFEEASQRQWVGLTDEDVYPLANEHLRYQPESYEASGVSDLTRAIEAKLKEKNT
jgi:hypothetical protein